MANDSIKVYRETFPVRYRDTGRNGHLKLAGWFDALQETAASHAELLGFGYAPMQKSRRLWVLNRLRLGIIREPRACGMLEVETWPSAPERLFARREFRCYLDGELAGMASSRWAVIDADTRRLRRLDDLAAAMPDNSDREVWSDFADKIADAPAEGEKFPVPVRYTLEDVNGHMNNAEYAGLVQDWLVDRERNRPVSIAEAELIWRLGISAPETLTLTGNIDADGAYLVSGRNAAGDVVFSARGRMKR